MRIKRANNCMEDFLNSRTINEVIKRKLFHSLIQMLKVILLRNISTGMVQQQTTRKLRIKGDGRRRETLEDRIQDRINYVVKIQRVIKMDPSERI